MPIILCLTFFALDVHAAIDNAGVMDNVLDRYSAAAAGWAGAVTSAATWLFWTLVLISMVWTFGMMALRKADIGEFFSEFVRFTIFTGFFWWLLTNGPNFASSIYTSLRQIAGNATGLGSGLSPSGIVDVGFAIFDKVLDQSTLWSPADSMAGILMAVTILVILALVGVNMLLLLTSGWVLAYGGVFFLGFGGSRWTTDMAINYYKTVLGVAAQLMAMVLLVGIGKTFLDDYYSRMSEGISLKEMGVMMIVTIILLALVNKIPPLIAGIVTGASAGGFGIGNLGAGAALGATGMAAATTAAGSATIAAGATSAAGGAQAVMAAFTKASENVTAGTDILSHFVGSSAGGNSTGSTTFGRSPFAQVAGFADGGSSEISTPRNSASMKAGKTEGMDTKSNDDRKADQAKNEDAKSKSSSDGQKITTPNKPTILETTTNAVGTVGRIAADATANLAQGIAEVAKEKAAGISDAAKDRVAETTGGKIAAAIKGQDSSIGPTFGENSLGSAESSAADPDSEVAAFRDRDNNQSNL
jgi:type IV secretion system protein TrbL